MRYWISLVPVALFACSVSITAKDLVEIVGEQSVEQKLHIAKQISHAVVASDLQQQLKKNIPELGNKDLSKLLSVGWWKTHTLISSGDDNEKDAVFVRCIFKSTLSMAVAKKAVKICRSYVVAELDATTMPDAALAFDQSALRNQSNADGVLQSGLSAAEYMDIRSLLVNRKFTELNAVLAQYLSEYQLDSKNEQRLIDAYRAFRMPELKNQPLFTEWLELTPNTAQPYLASAQAHFSRGWTARGYSYMSDVSKSDKATFLSELGSSSDMAYQAIALNDDLLPAYLTLIEIEKSTKAAQGSKPIATQAFEQFPDSITLRAAQLVSLQPRWGGSFVDMNQFVKASIKSNPNNPDFKLLRGLVEIEKSRVSYFDSQYSRALTRANDAIQYGNDELFYSHRASVNLALDKLDAALNDINTAIKLRPTNSRHYSQRAKYYAKLGRVADAKNDLALARKLSFETNTKIERVEKWAAKSMSRKAADVYTSDLSKAVAYYDAALLFDDQYQYAAFWRAMALIKLGKDEKAIAGLEHSLKLDPTHFESYRELDYLLLKEGRWNEIVANWDLFLQLEPSHAQAYLERAGAHHHNGNEHQARADLDRACELDSKQACTLLANLGDM